MKVTSSKVVIDDKKKKKASGSTGAWNKRDTPKKGFGGEDSHSLNAAAPRVGGTAPKASGLKGATKKQVKKAKSMVSKSTGSGASKQAKAASLRAYR